MLLAVALPPTPTTQVVDIKVKHADSADTGRVVGKADDPLVPELIDDIEARCPGHMTGQGVNVHRPDGSVLMDLDIVTGNAVSQVKSGTGKGALKQQARGSVIRSLEQAGMLVTRDKSLLLEVIRP